MANYPITANDRRAGPYTAIAAQTVFGYDFPIYADAEIKVYRTRAGVTTLLTLTTDYTVSGVGAQAGGNVTLTSGSTAGDVINVIGSMPNARATDFQESGDFRADTVNLELDRLTIQLQELASKVGRAVAVSEFDDVAALNAVPAKTARASRLLGFDANGQPIVSTQTIAQIEAGSTAAAASAAAAAAAAIAAAAAQAATEAVLDSFDDRYLGAKAADPTTDNDGNALLTGAIYYNIPGTKFRYWNGSAWADAFPSGTVPIGSGGTGQTTADAALYALIAGATVDTAPNIGTDKIAYAKASGTTGRAMSIQAFWNLLNSLTAYTSPNVADEVAVRDGSGGGAGVRKITLANLLAVVNGLTADTAPDGQADYLATYDASAGGAKKSLLVDAVMGALKLASQTASASAKLATGAVNTTRHAAYLILLDQVKPTTNGDVLWLRASTDGGSTLNSSTTFAYASWAWSNAPASGAGGSGGDSKVALTGAVSSANRGVSGFVLILLDGASSFDFNFVSCCNADTDSSGNENAVIVMGASNLSGVNGFGIQFSTNTIASGTMRVIGLPK